jgi:hypothetical protein
MSSEDRVLAALKALAEHDRDWEAPADVEARVMAGFRRQRRPRRAWFVAAAAVAAAGVIGIVWTPRHRDVLPPMPAISQPAASHVEAVVPATPPQPKKVLRRKKPAPPAPVVREVATEFFPLVDSAPPFESGELLRVIVPASTMRSVGLPVREDRWTEPVQADILFGQEGIARAIRFVRYEQ